MADRFATRDPVAAANYFAQPLPGTAENDYEQLRSVAARWARDNYKAATEWAKGQEEKAHFAVLASEFAEAAAERNDTAETARWKAVAEKGAVAPKHP